MSGEIHHEKTLRTIIAILTAGLMLMAFAACDEKKEETPKEDTVKEDTVKEDTLMKEIFDNVTASESYKSLKEMNPEARIEEKLDGSKIIFTVTSDNEGGGDITNDASVKAGEYVFTHEGDYVVYTSQDAAHMNNSFLVNVSIAIYDRLGMDFVTANDYLAENPDSTYYSVDEKANTVRIYAAKKWDIK